MRMDSVLHYLQLYAKTKPEKLCLCAGKNHLTYAQYYSNIRKMAQVLLYVGIQTGDHVIIRCTQNIEYLVIFTALEYIKALPIPVEKTISGDRIEEIARQVDANILISDKAVEGIKTIDPKPLYKEMEQAEECEMELPKADEYSMILFTTGTTGQSKGVVIKHLNDVAISENIIDGCRMKESNVEVIPMPLNHAFGIRRYQADMVRGATVCLMDGMVFVGALWKLMDTYHVSSMALSPATLSMIFKLSDQRIGDYKEQLDYVQIGSAPLSEKDKKRILELLPNTRLYNFYGSSEAGCSCILDFNSEDDKVGCIGRPTVNSIVGFVDEDGNEVLKATKDMPALLNWGGDIVMEGYYNDIEQTNLILDKGFVKTKDMAYMDEEGRIILIGRVDDIINYGGQKISPAEVEKIGNAYEYIKECVCSSYDDSVSGETPAMLVVKGEGYEEDAFINFLVSKLESIKIPRKILYVDEIPKTFKGSLQRKQIKELVNSMISREREGK